MALNEITVKQDLSNIDILDNVESMLQCIESEELRKIKREDVGKYNAELGKRFPHLKGRYPQIFNMVMMYERTFDLQKLRWMLDMLDKRKSGAMSETTSDNRVVYSQFDEYVVPKIDYEKEKEGMDKKRM